MSAFFDGIEAGKHDSLSLRESVIPLPGREEGYSRILFTGTTGAGKTTLLRHVIGSRHAEDRFPSTSTARTTTAEIETVTADGRFEAAITFMPEHEVRAHIDECIEEARLRAVEGKSDDKIMGGLLAHREQRFRLSYILGGWGQEADETPEDDFSFDGEGEETEQIPETEAVSAQEIDANRKRLENALARIKDIGAASAAATEDALGAALVELNPDDRSAWLELITDVVKGPNLRDHNQKNEHVLSSARDAIGSLRDAIGSPVAAALEARIENSAFYLGGLDREIDKIPSGFHAELQRLLEIMQSSGAPIALVDLVPTYTGVGLETAFANAVAGFRSPWQARLGFLRLSDFPKEHWTRVKALARRLALGWNNNEYDYLRPVADLVARLQENISRWLDSPAGWNRSPGDAEEQTAALDPIRNAVFVALHKLAEERVAELHRADWTTAFDYSGPRSSYKRADEIQSIYSEAAPSINEGDNAPARDFLVALHRLVRGAVENAGGRFDGG